MSAEIKRTHVILGRGVLLCMFLSPLVISNHVNDLGYSFIADRKVSFIQKEILLSLKN